MRNSRFTAAQIIHCPAGDVCSKSAERGDDQETGIRERADDTKRTARYGALGDAGSRYLSAPGVQARWCRSQNHPA